MKIGMSARGAHSEHPPVQRAVSEAFIPVLLFHSIRAPALRGLEKYTISERAFADHVGIIRSHCEGGATPLLISDLAAGLRSARPLPTRPFAVTFDDGYDDNLPAIHALAEAGIPSTLYVVASCVGRPGMLDDDQLRELARHPMVEVGAHTVNHPHLDELSRPEIVHELQAARTYLQELTGALIDSVAYPHGAHDRRVLAEARRAGYSSGVAVKNALSRPGDDPFAIARWTVFDSHAAQDLARVLNGEISIVGPGEHLRTRGFRVVRRTRRQLSVTIHRR